MALSALEAKNEVEKDQPKIALKHDPTAGLNLEQAVADKMAAQRKREDLAKAADAFPPGLEAFLPQDPVERERAIARQRAIERRIRQGGNPQPQGPQVAPRPVRGARDDPPAPALLHQPQDLGRDQPPRLPVGGARGGPLPPPAEVRHPGPDQPRR